MEAIEFEHKRKFASDLLANFLLTELREDDLNVQPSGYTRPYVSAGSGLSHHLLRFNSSNKRCRALWSVLVWLLTPSLCTFRTTCTNHVHNHFVRLGSGLPPTLRCGFPEFTRFFTTRHRIVLQIVNLQPLALPIEHHRRNMELTIPRIISKTGLVKNLPHMPYQISCAHFERYPR